MSRATADPTVMPNRDRLEQDDPGEFADIVNILESYRHEAEQNRRGGLNPRDDKWTQNLDLYWNRHDFGEKADWQAKEVMPEVPAFVDRFSAALTEALLVGDFYTVNDPYDTEGDITRAIKRMTDVWLSTSGRNQVGQLLSFDAVFEEQMKMGALMATSAVVQWKDDVPNGRVAVETVDPRFVWLDHTYRNLYRIRRVEVDHADLAHMLDMTDPDGMPLFNTGEINRLMAHIHAEEMRWREEATGHGQERISDRRTIILDEYIATVVAPDGTMLADNALMVVANNNFLVRGPERNPYWHNKDWLVFAPLITAPQSVYGRTYMEDFGTLARTFTELTNLILDAVQTSSLKAFVMVPEMLANPRQAHEGIHGNKIFFLQEGFAPADFAKELDLGTLDPASVSVWQTIKSELTEAAGVNEIGLGQFAPRGRTSATEVQATQQSSSSIIRSVARTVETRFLDPVLDLVWKTGLQHASRDDLRMADAVGTELYPVLLEKRRELIRRPITFQARGISALIARTQMLQDLLQLMQIIGQNENLMAAFMEQVDIQRLLDLLFELSNVDPRKLQATDRERLVGDVIRRTQERAQQGQASEAGSREMGEITQLLGIGRQ